MWHLLKTSASDPDGSYLPPPTAVMLRTILRRSALVGTAAGGTLYYQNSLPAEFVLEVDLQTSTTDEAIGAISRAATDTRVCGLVAQLGGARLSLAESQEIGYAVSRFGDSKGRGKTFAYAPQYDSAPQYLLACGFGAVVQQPDAPLLLPAIGLYKLSPPALCASLTPHLAGRPATATVTAIALCEAPPAYIKHGADPRPIVALGDASGVVTVVRADVASPPGQNPACAAVLVFPEAAVQDGMPGESGESTSSPWNEANQVTCLCFAARGYWLAGATERAACAWRRGRVVVSCGWAPALPTCRGRFC